MPKSSTGSGKKGNSNNHWTRYYEAFVTGWYNSRTGLSGRLLWVQKRSGKDCIPWDVLQAIKNELLGPDAVCVEVYPSEPNLVNEVNRRWLWEVPDDFLPFGLHLRGQ